MPGKETKAVVGATQDRNTTMDAGYRIARRQACANHLSAASGTGAAASVQLVKMQIPRADGLVSDCQSAIARQRHSGTLPFAIRERIHIPLRPQDKQRSCGPSSRRGSDRILFHVPPRPTRRAYCSVCSANKPFPGDRCVVFWSRMLLSGRVPLREPLKTLHCHDPVGRWCPVFQTGFFRAA